MSRSIDAVSGDHGREAFDESRSGRIAGGGGNSTALIKERTRSKS
jgi:hypothetical protein